MSLTKQEIDQRLIELRNLRKLYGVAKERIIVLEAENRALKNKVKELEAENKLLRGEVTDIKYQLAEMKDLIFKKTRQANQVLESAEEDDDDTPPRPPRTKESYQRPIPKDSEITKIIHHRLPRDKYGNIRLRTYYVEDIPLGVTKLVEKHVVEQYYDKARRLWVSKDTLPTGQVILGDNVRVLIATLITVERLSYSQVQGLLNSLFQIKVSSGEIAKILAQEAKLLKPTKQTLLANIQREVSHHLDESRYDVAGQTHYVWSISGGESGDTVYLVGQSRGKGNAEKLRGDSKGVLVSDDYGAYRKLATHHQLCFAHLIRHFRDLAHHPGFAEIERQSLARNYLEIKAIYQDTKTACHGPDPQGQRASLIHRLTAVASINPADPLPLKRIKTTLLRNIDKYFTCLSFPLIALTNNLAERSLRHLVLKRKVSFGVQSHKGAETMSILFSVLLSLRRRDPVTYFEKYLELRRV
jgi:hypothetical protein